MPNRNLTPQDDNESISNWLEENLNNNNSLIPLSDPIPPNLTSKGIYFWFMDPNACSEFLIENLASACIKDCIERDKKHLVYVGTAGTRKTKSDNNKSNLRERLDWHINKNIKKNNVCSETMSTLRITIGSLIGNSLIKNNAQVIITNLFEKYFKIYYLSYQNIEAKDLRKQVNNDEKIIIDKIKPLFNIRNNPNALKKNNIKEKSITFQIKERRIKILKATKEEFNCAKKGINSKIPKSKKNSQGEFDKKAISKKIIQNKNGEYVFNVTRKEEISKISDIIKSLPEGECCIKIFDDKGIELFQLKNNKPRTTHKLLNYFNSDESNTKISRKKFIKDKMETDKIEFITLKINYK